MKKKLGHYIAGLSVIAAMNATGNYIAKSGQDNDDIEDKVEYKENTLRQDLKEACKDAQECFNDFFARFSSNKDKGQTSLELREELREDSLFSYDVIEEIGKAPRIKNLQYQNDTISIDEEKSSTAYYRQSSNTITDIIVEGEKQDTVETLISLAHEAEHMHQYNKVNFSADMSFEQHYQLHNYTEIGATMAGLLQVRQMYKEAKTDEERNEIIEKGKGRYRYYFDKVESGEINPLSNSVKDFDEEMKFIADETAIYWHNNYGVIYRKDHNEMVLEDIQKGTGNVKADDVNFSEARDQILNIGGISFSDVMTEVIGTISIEMIRADGMLRDGANIDNVIDALKKDGLRDDADVFLANVNNPELKHFSYEQRYNLAINSYFASLVKGIEDDVSAKEFNGGIPSICEKDSIYQKTGELIEKMCHDEGWLVKASDKEYKDELRKIWSYKDENGNDACFLDKLGVDEPDFSKYVASSEKLRKKDAYSFSNSVEEHFASFVENKRDVDSVSKYRIGEKYQVGLNDVSPMNAPDYNMEFGERRSDVMQTNEIIDTRSDFLARERQGRLDNAKLTLEEDLSKIHPKTEKVKEIHINDLIKMVGRE
ncbi:MAG: hypothetical protein IJZ30_04165 [Alphaproteobacteria bacterium]|nr:hypothetical protein [Alphaproteobacteria bacterium]